MATRLTQQQRGRTPAALYTNSIRHRHRRQTATLCDTTTRISQPNTSHTRHHKNTADRFTKPTSLLLARNKGAQREQGECTAKPRSNHRGCARSPQPSELSWHTDFAREKRQGCAAVWTTYLALQRQHGHGHAMQHARWGVTQVCDSGHAHANVTESRCRPPPHLYMRPVPVKVTLTPKSLPTISSELSPASALLCALLSKASFDFLPDPSLTAP